MSYSARHVEETLASTFSHLPPALVIGSSEHARARGVAEIENAGLRLAGSVAVEDGVERIAQQVSASAVWIELDRDQGAPLDRLLERVNREADAGAYAAIVSTPATLLDPVMARIDSARVDVLVGGDATERVAALALACALPAAGARLSDVAADNSAAKLRQLSDDVSRIASTLARLSAGPDATPAMREAAAAKVEVEPPAELTREQVTTVIRARRARARYFADDLFADPAWDMLLDLTQAEIAHIRVPVSSLCIAAAVPATTALRWIKTLTDTGIFVRRADPLDGRRVFVEMAAATSQAMRRYFGEVGPLIAV